MPPQIINILCFFSGRLAAPDFVMNCIEARAVRWLEIWKFMRVSYIIAISQWRSKWRTECQRRVDTARGKDIDHAAESIKSYNIISLQISEDTIIWFISSWLTNCNGANYQFLNFKVSQGSVAMHLRRDGIFSGRFVTQSLLSPTVKEYWKLVKICRSYGPANNVASLKAKPCDAVCCTIDREDA